jgi:hypothetical protein
MAHVTKASLIGLVHVNKSNEGDLLNRIMASKAMTAVPRGYLFCAKRTPVNPAEDSEDSLFADAGSGGAEFVFGQIKNNLAAKIVISHRYHMETVIVGYDEEAEKDIKPSKIVMDEIIPENVEDIVINQEKARRGVRTRSDRAESWLVGFLAGKGRFLVAGW